MAFVMGHGPRPGDWRTALLAGGLAAGGIGAAAYALAGAAGMTLFPAWLAVAVGALALAVPVIALLQLRSVRDRGDALGQECEALRLRLDRDPLTNLTNRAAFNRALDDLASIRSGSGNIIILFFDLDRFKDVNDTLGHKVGDHLLIEVARRAGTVLEGAIAFARLGGDEFAAIVPCNAVKRPEDYGHAIVEVMNEPFLIDGRTVDVAASVGIAVGDTLLDDGHELLRRADVAMYEAKGSPRGGCRIYDDMLSGRQIRESSIRVELGKSMIEQAFELHYQPIVDARTGRFSSAEALLRSQSPTLSDVTTSNLISIAEASGQIMPLTEWTLDTALQAIQSLETSSIAVNVSPVYFRQPDFVHRIFDKLLAARTRPELLTVEVTEGVLIADIAAARHSISRLREIGIKVYLDDFGTGYSSLSYLQHFELDGLKLDKSFLREVGDRRKATQIIRSIIDFGHSLDMRVVVEGVESDWQARLLQLLGCDLLQGYELGVPMPLDALRDLRDRSLLGQPSQAELSEWNKETRLHLQAAN
jgi:diguanylate cyclase (GGDEF)-like protein